MLHWCWCDAGVVPNVRCITDLEPRRSPIVLRGLSGVAVAGPRHKVHQSAPSRVPLHRPTNGSGESAHDRKWKRLVAILRSARRLSATCYVLGAELLNPPRRRRRLGRGGPTGAAGGHLSRGRLEERVRWSSGLNRSISRSMIRPSGTASGRPPPHIEILCWPHAVVGCLQSWDSCSLDASMGERAPRSLSGPDTPRGGPGRTSLQLSALRMP